MGIWCRVRQPWQAVEIARLFRRTYRQPDAPLAGHSFISLCFYGILTSWWMRMRPDPLKRGIVLLASTNAIALIGASRVYLGVHYPSDVLAGFAAAVPWLTACLTGYAQYEKRMALLAPGPKPKALIEPKPPRQVDKDKEDTDA